MNAELPHLAATNGTKTVKRPVVCYQSIRIASAGVWFGDNPLSFALPLLLAQLTTIFAFTTTFHFLLKRLGQPKAVSHIVAGFVLGVSGIGRDKAYLRTFFPASSRIHMDILSEIALMLFLFMIGVKTDVGRMWKSGKQVWALGVSSTLIPMGLVAVGGYLLRDILPPDFVDGQFIYKFASTWSRTSYVVLFCLLSELKLLNSKVGRLAMPATLISDCTSTVADVVYTTVQLSLLTRDWKIPLASFLSSVALVAFIFWGARPLTLWMIRRTAEGEQLDETYFVIVLMLMNWCGLAGELIGHHAGMGTLLLGLLLPGGPPLGLTLDDRFDVVVSGLLIPILMGGAGFRCNFFSISDGKRCGCLLLLIFLCFVGKVVGVVLPCLFCRVPFKDVKALILMLGCRGIFEVYTLQTWRDTDVVDEEMYAVILLCVVVFSAITTPLLKFNYKPSTSYIARKRRTIQHSKPDSELHIMACVHGEHDVNSAVSYVMAFHPTKECPINVCVLHLVQLAGQTSATLASYEPSPSTHHTETDHIMNAFHHLAVESLQGSLLLQLFYAISPQDTMHDDVCSLAMDKKVSFIFLPFHKHRAIDGTLEAANDIRKMNINVLNYAPCSVSVYIDHAYDGGSQFTHSTTQMHHIGVYFLGGPDDREALAYSMMVAERAGLLLTVIRLRPPREWQVDGDPEAAADGEYVNEFRARMVDGERVTYREEEVRDGEGTVGVIRATSHYFSLLVVGRRKGVESPLTEGLSMWSEYPELGIIGDVLACTDFGGHVATLVVQQQARVGSVGPGDGLGGCNPATLRSRFGFSRRASPLAEEGV